ncbi:MAG: YggS family pyridoxal phosphate-dependent enzyme [Anaerolineales bacterium]|nr:YggS family pyridoxal phosphate-dependent enzyme [Anaerolineales bacterium]
MTTELKTRYLRVLEEIEQAAQSAGRQPEQIDLVVVTKGHPAKAIEELFQLGARQVGENRLAEGLEKQIQLSHLADLTWHMIGHVQSRKAADIAGKFSLIHSLDSVKLARRLDRFASQAGITQEVLLQFNTSGEASKFGFNALQGQLFPEMITAIEEILSCTHLRLRGLMTMAPYSPDPEDARPAFSALRRLQDSLAQRFSHTDWSQLSMGMSADFQVAIQEGATLLRIGTAIMGPIKI